MLIRELKASTAARCIGRHSPPPNGEIFSDRGYLLHNILEGGPTVPAVPRITTPGTRGKGGILIP